MNMLKSILFLLVTFSAITAYGASQEVQVDLLMAKILPLLKADKATEALPYMVELERMEPSMAIPLPESFHFNYIYALDKSGDKASALSRANAYLEKYGKKGKYYQSVIEITSRLQIDADKAAAERKVKEKADKEAAIVKENARLAHCRKSKSLEPERAAIVDQYWNNHYCDKYIHVFSNDYTESDACWADAKSRLSRLEREIEQEDSKCSDY